MNDAERLEEIDSLLDMLEGMKDTHIVLIEGNKDRRTLDALGLEDIRTIEVQREGGPVRAAEKVSGEKRSAVILTDWDRRGDRLEKELIAQLDALCIPYDTTIRTRLRDVCIKDIKDVESLDTLYARLDAIRQRL